MGQPISQQSEMTDTQFRMALLAVLGRIADALESQRAEEDQTITLPLGDYKFFDWSQIGVRILNSDESGPSQIWHEGKVYTRRSNDKFGQDIWFSRGDGKNSDGTPRYHKLIEFRLPKPAEPIGRKTEQAMHASATKPLTPPASPATAPMTQAAAIPPTTPATASTQEPGKESANAPANAPAEVSLEQAIEAWNDVARKAQRAGKRDVVQANSLTGIKDNVTAIMAAASRIEAALKEAALK